jgi:hypothetical protein
VYFYKGGTVHNSKLKQITVALCMALLPISVFAAGLGKLNVTSGLGEPLRADIESVLSQQLPLRKLMPRKVLSVLLRTIPLKLMSQKTRVVRPY